MNAAVDVLAPALPEVLGLLAAGRFQDALEPLRAAVREGETDPVTVLNLAIAEDRAGDTTRAQRLMHLISTQLPDWDEPVLRLAESLRAQGERAAAEDAYRHVLTINPNREEALLALAGLLLMRQQADAAHDLLRRCCDLAPGNPEAWKTLGVACSALHQPQQAYSALVKAQRLCPHDLTLALAIVDAAILAGSAEDELRRLESACEQDPLNPTPHVSRGLLLERLGQPAAAVDALDAAHALAPDNPQIMHLLAGFLSKAAKASQAEKVLRIIIENEPENAAARSDLAAALMRLHRHREAQTFLRDALDRHGHNASFMSNLANATVCLGEQDEAVAIARQAIALEPQAPLPRRALCNTMVYQHGASGRAVLAAMQACSDVLPRTPQPSFANTPDPGRPLTVGLLSGSLRNHPVGWLTVAGIENLDRDQFQVICLAQHAAPHDPIARRYCARAQEWIDVDALSDQAVTDLARSRQIDILIDLGGYGDAARMTACANRLAPVQIKWVGMQSHSTGLAEMDWFLTDRWETPPGFEQFYSERLLRMPDGYVCYSPPVYAPDVAPLPALSNGFVTFGCFNNLAKITPVVIETWAAILRRVPNARLVLKTHQLKDPITVDRLQAAFAAHGISADRLDLRGPSGHRAFLAEYGDIDIVLDPFPYSGGLTTCEALWMGVPTITCPGETFASRHSVSHMCNAGLPDWVANSIPEYIDMAVARAANLPALAELRAGLREQTRLSPLCDARRFGASLGAALRTAWRAWCEGS